MNNHPAIDDDAVVGVVAPLTPATESGIKSFFEGLSAISETLVYSAPARAAISVTPAIRDLLVHFCCHDPRFERIMANVWVQDYQSIKHHSLKQ